MANELPYYLPNEILLHNTAEDLWVSALGKVYDLSELVKEFEGKKEIQPLLTYAGKDVSHWFDKRTKDVCKVLIISPKKKNPDSKKSSCVLCQKP